MYRTGQKYKIQLKNGIVYTAEILEESTNEILISTIRNEELILNKQEIVQSRLEQNSTGDIIENNKSH